MAFGTGKKKQPQTTDPHKQQTPYGGSVNGKPVETAPHLLVAGMTGSGKTTRVLAPGALLWRGPVVAVSSKVDFMKLTVENRARRGPVYLLDLSGEVDDNAQWLPPNVTRVVSDPCSLITNDDDALAMSSLLMKVGALGASDNGQSGGGNDSFWQTLAAQPLAALLQAGAAEGGIDWALRAAGKYKGTSAEDTSPSWVSAYDRVNKTSRHAEDLLSVGQLDAKLKDSVSMTMKSGLAPWLLTTVAGPRSAAQITKPFAPRLLEQDREPTLYIIAPADGVAAGAAVAVIETIIRHWRRGIERGLPRVLLSIDEAVNTAPMPKLPAYITESRGLGVAMVIAVQSTSQMVLRWGEDGAKVIRDIFPAAIVLKGAPEREMLEQAAWWDGEADRWTETIDWQEHKTRSAERAPRTSATDLLPTSYEEGRLLLGGQKGLRVDLPGIWRF